MMRYRRENRFSCLVHGLQPIQLRFEEHAYHLTFTTPAMMKGQTPSLIVFTLAALTHLGKCQDSCDAGACQGNVSSRGLLQVDKTLQHRDSIGTTVSTTWASPYYMMSCPGTPALTTQRMTGAQYDDITAAVTALYDSLPSRIP